MSKKATSTAEQDAMISIEENTKQSFLNDITSNYSSLARLNVTQVELKLSPETLSDINLNINICNPKNEMVPFTLIIKKKNHSTWNFTLENDVQALFTTRSYTFLKHAGTLSFEKNRYVSKGFESGRIFTLDNEEPEQKNNEKICIKWPNNSGFSLINLIFIASPINMLSKISYKHQDLSNGFRSESETENAIVPFCHEDYDPIYLSASTLLYFKNSFHLTEMEVEHLG